MLLPTVLVHVRHGSQVSADIRTRQRNNHTVAMNLAGYLRRIGLTDVTATTRADPGMLARVMEAHSRAIAFENCDVVYVHLLLE